MKKLLLIILVGFVGTTNAQVPDYGILSENLIVTDTDAVEHNFYDILDEGKPIILNMFAEWCQPCRSYYDAGALNDLYNTYGAGGSDEVFVISVEADPQTPASYLEGGNGTQGWDWLTNSDYPMADQNIGGIFNLGYFPTIVMICPDRSVIEVGAQSAIDLYNASQGCNDAPTLSNDPRLIENESDEVFCQGEVAAINVVLQNFGSDTLTACTIEVFNGENSEASVNWTGQLSQFEFELVSMGTFAPDAATNYTVKITTENDDTSNDELQVEIKPAEVLKVDQDSATVTFDLIIDDYASELGIVFNEGTPPSNMTYVQLYQNAAANSSNYLGFVRVGSLTNGTNSFTETYNVNNPGCHYALFVDSYGDGINFQKPDAKIDILGVGGTVISEDPGYGTHVFTVFDIEFVSTLSVDKEEFARNIRLYPNPASNLTNIEFTNNDASNTVITVVNAVGQEVYYENLGVVNGLNVVELNVASFDSGIYFVNIKTENTIATKRLSVSN